MANDKLLLSILKTFGHYTILEMLNVLSLSVTEELTLYIPPPRTAPDMPKTLLDCHLQSVAANFKTLTQSRYCCSQISK